MCGIIGLLVKQEKLRSQLGEFVAPMVECLGSRGADSAGLAVFSTPLDDELRRFALFAADRRFDWPALDVRFRKETGANGDISFVENHAAKISAIAPGEFKEWLAGAFPDVHLLSVGRRIDVYKDAGDPGEIARRFHLAELTGTHAVGHTRMATESAVSPAHAHPFTAGEDFCLVHNGSLSNPYSIRRKLEKRHVRFETDNDTEAGCRFLEWRMREGDTLEEAIERSFSELDGFFTFVVATGDRLVLVRDALACKPAVVAETDDYVAIGSEFRSLAHLPEIEAANVFEPQPQQVYSWTV